MTTEARAPKQWTNWNWPPRRTLTQASMQEAALRKAGPPKM
jgi:hypothetical protein